MKIYIINRIVRLCSRQIPYKYHTLYHRTTGSHSMLQKQRLRIHSTTLMIHYWILPISWEKWQFWPNLQTPFWKNSRHRVAYCCFFLFLFFENLLAKQRNSCFFRTGFDDWMWCLMASASAVSRSIELNCSFNACGTGVLFVTSL